MKGQCDKEECVAEWDKYRHCLSVTPSSVRVVCNPFHKLLFLSFVCFCLHVYVKQENLDGKLLTRMLEVDAELNPTKQS